MVNLVNTPLLNCLPISSLDGGDFFPPKHFDWHFGHHHHLCIMTKVRLLLERNFLAVTLVNFGGENQVHIVLVLRYSADV